MLAKWNGTAWQDANQIGFYGNEVRVLDVINNQLMIGGDFELPTGALRRNVMAYDGTQPVILGFGTLTPVNDFALYNNKIYAACDAVYGNDTCALAVYNSTGDWEKVIIPFNLLGSVFSGEKIMSLAVNGNEMLCGGSFTVASGLYYGQNIMRFQQNSAAPANDYTLSPILFLDSTVNVITMNSGMAYFGGDFVANNMSNILNHVGYFDVLTGIKQTSKTQSNELSVYPNPAIENCMVNFSTSFKDKDYLVISNGLGQEISHINLPKGVMQFPLELAGLASGIYHINVYSNDKIYHQKLMIKK
jgi:hypothetical protein